MTNQKRRQWTAEQKLQIIEEARQTDATVSEVCRRHALAQASSTSGRSSLGRAPCMDYAPRNEGAKGASR